MAFQFGNVRASERPKQNLEKFDALLKENYQPGHKYFLFLVDNILHKVYLDILCKDIDRYGIKSYNIVSVISVKDPKNDSTEELLSLESNWRQYLTFDGTECECVIAFGPALRVLNKSGDVNYYDFLDDVFNEPRYWCGKEFINGPDRWVYPVAPIRDLYPIDLSNDPTNFLTRFFYDKLARIQKDDMSTKNLDMRDYKIIYAEDKQDSSRYLKLLENSVLLAADTETSGLSFLKDRLGVLSLSNDGETGYVFDWENVDKRLLKKVLMSAKRLTLANAKFDTKFIWRNGVTGWLPTDDTVLLSHALNSNRSKSLKSGAIFYCGKFTGYEHELDLAKKRLKVENYLQIPKDILHKYAGLDPIVTWRLQKALDKHVEKLDKKYPNEKDPTWTIKKFYKEVMIPNANVVTDVEYKGVYVNKDQFDISEKAIKEKIVDLKKKLAVEWGVQETFEFESTKKLGQLFKDMGWEKIAEAKDGGYKTSDDVLTEYELLNKPGIKELKKLRSYNVALGTFIEGWKKWLFEHPDGTWRIHPNCNTFGTESFRHAMNDPNFQQIPSRGEIAPYIKRLFTVPPNVIEDDLVGESKSDWLLVNADFRSLQLILAFCDCGINPNGVDKIAYDIYGPDGCQDAHSMTTHGVFCAPIHMQVIEIEDDNGKKIIFGEEQKIKIKRLGLVDDEKELVIKGKEFTEEDIFLDYV